MTVIVLFGGRSDERQVSVASAQNVVRALDNPLAWFWAPNGAIHDVATADLLAHQRPFEIEGNGIEEKLPGDLPRGDRTTFQVNLAPGTYKVYCPIKGHEAKGMVKTITVR